MADWHGAWSPEHPVGQIGEPMPLYLSVADAVQRILTALWPEQQDPALIERALRSGRSVSGFRLYEENPLG